ncbi:MAG: hypothetical protein ACODAQ_02535 [Phycisphaeraceae bacterium]
MNLPRFLFCSLALMALTTPVHAQTGAGLVQSPWQGESRTEVAGGVYWYDEADIDDTDNDLDLMRYETRGRYRSETSGHGDELRFGYDLLHLDLHTSDPMLPERLTDVSLATSWTRALDQGRSVGGVAGIGYAGDAPFGEGDAVYFQGDLIYDQPLSEQSKLTFTLNYHGNRTIWPDVPLPLVSYTRRASDELIYTIGVPFTSFRWQPMERLTVTATYLPVVTVDARVEYELNEAWRIFGQFDNVNDPFVVDGNEDRRLFFRQRRLEAGVRYLPSERVEWTFAAGYAFDQEFERGWDVRDTDTVRELDDTPFVRAAVGFRF